MNNGVGLETLEFEPLRAFGEQPGYLEPLVRAIWPTRADEIYSLFLNGGSDLDAESDHPFAIRLGGEYVGITGFYRYDQFAVGLCWHGVIPAVRGRGVSRAAFEKMCSFAAERYPDANEIVELIPNDRSAELTPYFSKLGFRHDSEIATLDYLPKGPVWRVYRAPLVTGIHRFWRAPQRCLRVILGKCGAVLRR